MTISFAIAIYFIIWWLTLFAVLPFGLRTQHDQGEVVPGTPASAPMRNRMLRSVLITTVVSAVIFGVAYLAFSRGWVTLLDPPRRPG